MKDLILSSFMILAAAACSKSGDNPGGGMDLHTRVLTQAEAWCEQGPTTSDVQTVSFRADGTGEVGAWDFSKGAYTSVSPMHWSLNGDDLAVTMDDSHTVITHGKVAFSNPSTMTITLDDAHTTLRFNSCSVGHQKQQPSPPPEGWKFHHKEELPQQITAFYQPGIWDHLMTWTHRIDAQSDANAVCRYLGKSSSMHITENSDKNQPFTAVRIDSGDEWSFPSFISSYIDVIHCK